MTRTLASTLLLGLVWTTGCNTAADEQAKATQAGAEANKDIAAARGEVREVRDEAARDIANAERTSQEVVKNAQAEAEKTIGEAQASFDKLREDYRHRVATDLVDVDRRIDLLSAKAGIASAQTKRTLDGHLATIRMRRAAHADELKRLDTASASTWDAAKVRVDTKWTELKTALDRAT